MKSSGLSGCLAEIRPYRDHKLFAYAELRITRAYMYDGPTEGLRVAQTLREAFEDEALEKALTPWD